ncbi:hypothetical protein M3Y99_00889000 [Aphelenchoides fujianensis]|nr:hypothetical protein M3Y99_00889000 [Aphelenchoides fujianensis]
MGHARRLLVVFLLLLQFNYCNAYDWGDFHKFAVIFFSLLGTFVGLGAIFTVIYFACFKAFLDRFKDEVLETHRLHHPWPIGSARWHLQQWSGFTRSASLTRPPPPQQPTYVSSQTNFPPYQAEGIKTPSIVVDRPTYYTPSGYQSPGKLEHTEEYHLVREESTLSQTSAGKPVETGSRTEDRIVRTTTTEHRQQILRPATYI